MSITGNLNVFPFSLTGLQNIDGTINGETPINDITIAGQTTYLSASAVDVNGDVVLDLHIQDASATATGLLTFTDWNTFNNKQNTITASAPLDFSSNIVSIRQSSTQQNGFLSATDWNTFNDKAGLGLNNIFTGTNQFNSNVLFASGNIYLSNLGTTIQPYFIAFNPSTGLITYNSTTAISILGTPNVFTGTNEFSDATFKLSGISLTPQSFVLGYNNVSKQVFYQATGADLLISNNVFSGTNYFSNVNIRFSGLTTSSDTSFLRINLSTGQISTSLISSLLLPTNNTFTGTNTFADDVLIGSTKKITVQNIVGNTLQLTGDTINFKQTGNTYDTMIVGDHVVDYYETNGDQMSYLIRNGITDLKWVVFRTPSSYAFYNTLSNTLGTTSDERTKKDIQAIDTNKSKEFILAITPSTFRFRDGNTAVKNIGFIAQDILKNSKTEAQKNIVSNWKIYEEQYGDPYEKYTDASGNIQMRKAYLGVSAMSIIPELVGTIQAQNREIESLKERLLKIERLLDLK